MAISAIISNLNGARFLPRLLDTLQQQVGVDLEIIVVDRCSRDESPAILSRYPQVKVVIEPAETGLVSGYHRGAGSATRENLFFCNEDMWFEADCLRNLERWISMERGIVASDPWQWTYDGQKWIHGGTRFKSSRWAINGVYPFRDFNFTVELIEGSVVPFPCAGAFLMARSAYEQLGGWDTSMFLDNEDIDLFVRAWQRGWTCVSVPSARVYHAVGSSNPQSVDTSMPRVSMKRYVSNRLGKTTIPIKTFSTGRTWMALANAMVMVANNLLKGRLQLLRWDMLVLKEIYRRRHVLREARKANAEWNQFRPGEEFFLAHEYQEPLAD
ncbi:glycosyltransferase family 2 protein [Verrucomicrobiota bacterium sgz303538]